MNSIFNEADKKNEEEILADLKAAFFRIDDDGSGIISPDELKDALKKLGEDLTDEEIEELVEAADLDGDGQIQFDEFV
mgnify:CR=1 FL=1